MMLASRKLPRSRLKSSLMRLRPSAGSVIAVIALVLASNAFGASAAKRAVPGTSCKHPLEVVNRGHTKQISLTLRETSVPAGTEPAGTERYWTWKLNKTVALCPYPNGVTLTVYRGDRVLEKEGATRSNSRSGHIGYEGPTGIRDVITIRAYFVHP
jgi:hypothetical protein